MPRIQVYINIAKTIIYSVMGLTAIIGSILYILNKKGKLNFKRKKKELDLSDAEHVSNKDFIDGIEDIDEDMVIGDDFTTFVGAIQIHGFNYGQATPGERLSVQEGMLELLTAVDFPIQMYDQCSEIDVDPNIKMLDECRENLQNKIKRYHEEILYFKQLLNTPISEEEKKEILDELNMKIKLYNAKLWQLDHNLEQKLHAQAIPKQEGIPNIDGFIFFSFEYDAGTFTVERTKEEIYKMAKNDLDSKANSLINILERREIRAERVVEPKLGDIYYRHFNPMHADIYKYKEKKNNISTNLFATSGSYEDIKRQVKEEKQRKDKLKDKFNLSKRGKGEKEENAEETA